MPHQFVNLDGALFLRVLASEVPSVGYKTFEILSGPGSAPTHAAATVGAGNATLENSRLRLAIDPDGAIASFIDKARPDAELAGNIGGLKLNDFARLGQSTPTALDTVTPQIHVLAGGQVDGASLGIPAQNGATWFLQCFALRPHGAYDPVAAMQFGLAQQNPLVTGAIGGGTNSPYPAASHSLIAISNPGVLLWALKPAEEGIANGIIARVWNVSATPAAATFSARRWVRGFEV